MAVTKSVTVVKPRKYAITWKGATIGYVKKMDLSALKPKLLEIKIEEIGDIVIDELVIANEGRAVTQLHQTRLDVLRALLLNAPGSGVISGFGTAYLASLYAAAGVLNAHPIDMGADLTEDFNILKATPLLKLPQSSEGATPQDLTCEWAVFPDRTQITAAPPVLLYFYVGEIPA